jgi:mono/diheme cytochrome c family protein
MTDPTKTYATCYVDNVYADLPNVEKGQVKYLRIAQQMFWITRAGQPGLQYHPLANASECFGYPGTGGPVRVFGLVPVEPDGSAHFQVPAGVDLYFQALDENYRAVQRMRTHVEFAPGEKRSCIGCHETKDVAVKIRPKGIALGKDPVRPTPPQWGDTTLIDYEKMVQPIFDAKCVKCHGNEKAKGGLNLSDKRDKYGFMQGYRAMFGLKPSDPTSNVVWTREGEVKKERFRGDRHPWYDIMYDYVIVRRSVRGEDSLVTPTKKYGAIAHPLVTTLLEKKSHQKLLTDEQLRLLVTWFDIQAPYFDTYMQQVRRGRDRSLERVRVDPWEPFGPVREHTIHRPGPLEQANAK